MSKFEMKKKNGEVNSVVQKSQTKVTIGMWARYGLQTDELCSILEWRTRLHPIPSVSLN